MRIPFIYVALILGLAQPAVPSLSLSLPRTDRGETSFPLRVEGTGFVDAGGTPFIWRGITAFRLAEMIAAGREAEAAAYLDWARSKRLTVVRVLLMAHHLFKLAPEDGRRALPRLLDLARERGISVEVVALADTSAYRFDLEAHVREVGRIADEKGNAFIELANEPGHQTQDVRLHDPSFARRLAALLPASLVVAFGSGEYGTEYTAGDYATLHLPRGKQWEHVLTLSQGAARVAELKKPVVSDEPIGAGPVYDEGRRDDEPSRFAAAAALTTLAGMGATFHYEAGLQAGVPKGREAECLDAWQAGLDLLSDLSLEGEFIEGDRVRSVVDTAGARAAFVRVSAREAVILLVDPAPGPPLKLAAGWSERRRAGVPGVQVMVVTRATPDPLPPIP